MIIAFSRKRPSRSSRSESGSRERSSPREEGGRFHKSSITRLLACLATALAVTAGLFVVQAPAASAADITTDLGITSGGDVVAGGGKAFIAGGDRILVVNANGTPNATIAGLSGALGLAIAPNGTRLYAALRDSNEVAVIDTASLEIIRLISLAEYPCPTNLALSGTRLFVGYGCDQWDGGVVRIDTSFGHGSRPTPVTSTYASPKVAAAGNTLVVGDALSPATLSVYDVNAFHTTLRGIIDGHDYHAGFLGDLAITPDGSTIIAAFLNSAEYFAWDTTSLQEVHAYGPDPSSGYYAPVVAVSPDGTRVAGGRGTKSGLVVTVYDSATTTPVYTGTLTDHGAFMDLRSLTFSNNDLFALWKDLATHHLHLWRLETGALPESTLTLTAPSTGTGADVLTLTGRLTMPDGSAPGEQPIAVTCHVNDSPGTTFEVTTAEDGTFTFKDRPGSAGVIRYDVIWNGSPTVHWSTASATVTLVKAVSSITLSAPETGTVGTQLKVTGTLLLGGQRAVFAAPLKISRKVTNSNGTVVTALPSANGASRDGSFRFTDTPPEAGEYTYLVQWDGNQASLPTSATFDVTIEEAEQG
ncbi:hypothetical protein [Microbispora hainanensis]|uniref:hypothetical protein n=1 Tax=Microbispora hainanensis TaxID=568844 RepID=UPI00142EEFF6|nr:hypothetical protein [Microbispora hainanensis]